MDEMCSCLHDHTYDGVVADDIARHHPRPYFLRASDVIERNMWMRDIRKVCLDKPSHTHKPLHLLAENKFLLFLRGRGGVYLTWLPTFVWHHQASRIHKKSMQKERDMPNWRKLQV